MISSFRNNSCDRKINSTTSKVLTGMVYTALGFLIIFEYLGWDLVKLSCFIKQSIVNHNEEQNTVSLKLLLY